MEGLTLAGSITPQEIVGLRRTFRWSQEDLAREVGVCIATIRKWELGRTPDEKYIWKFRRLLTAADSLQNVRKEIGERYPHDNYGIAGISKNEVLNILKKRERT